MVVNPGLGAALVHYSVECGQFAFMEMISLWVWLLALTTNVFLMIHGFYLQIPWGELGFEWDQDKFPVFACTRPGGLRARLPCKPFWTWFTAFSLDLAGLLSGTKEFIRTNEFCCDAIKQVGGGCFVIHHSVLLHKRDWTMARETHSPSN